MAHRTSLNKLDITSQKTFDLWMLRLLCRADVWKDIDTCSLGDADDFGSCFWFKPFRADLHWALAVYRNEEFLETGNVAKGRFRLSRNRFVSQKLGFEDEDNEDRKESVSYNDNEIIAPEKRLYYLRDRLQHFIEDAGDLLDIGESNLPDDIGQYWRRITRGGVVKRWLGVTRPESLYTMLAQFEESLPDEIRGLSGPFAENLTEIREAFGFSTLETRIFAFFLVISTRRSALGQLLANFDCSRNATDLLIDLTAVALAEDRERVKECVRFDSPLMRSGLVTIEDSEESQIYERISFLDASRFRSLLSTRIPLEKLLASTIKLAPESELELADYRHLPVVERVLLPYMEKALAEHRVGVNILLYGLPGTGKTQLARMVCDRLSAKLYEVATEVDEVGKHRQKVSRLQRWKTASAFLGSAVNTAIAIDEAEDVFNDGGESNAFIDLFRQKVMRTNKGEINKLLETNPVPTFWISNSIDTIDPAMIRRFDLVIEVPPPDVKGRLKLVEQAFAGKLSETASQRLAQTPRLAPAVLCRAASVASMVGFEEGRVSEEEIVGLVDATLRAQGFGAVSGIASVLPVYYDPRFVNADLDLVELARGLREAGGGRLCLYGPPGTGKSAYAAWLAAEINRPLVRKTVAEITSCYVGETEKLIAEAFAQAKRDNAVLLLDEADSFLRDRTLSQRSWETTQVNEMLAQMESYSGYFIATTNLLRDLDAASLRRFDLKAKFDFLKPEQSVILAEQQLRAMGLDLDDASRRRLLQWQTLTPGDFAAVERQSRFRPLNCAAAFVDRLGEEIKVKGLPSARKIGFC